MRIIICGDRNWTNRNRVYLIMSKLPKSTVIIEGAARGADALAGTIATELGLQLLVFPARWEAYGKRAGPIRNQQMIDEGKPTHVIAFHNDISASKGTKDMVLRAKKHEIPVAIVNEKGEYYWK